MDKKLLKQALEVLEFNKVDQVFMTADGEVFIDANNAVLHRSKIEAKELYTVHTSGSFALIANVSGMITDPEIKDESDLDAKKAAPAAKPEKVKPLAKMNKTELQEQATKRGIEFTDDTTNGQLLEMIEKVDESAAASAELAKTEDPKGETKTEATETNPAADAAAGSAEGK